MKRPGGADVIAIARLGNSVFMGRNSYKGHPAGRTNRANGLETVSTHAEVAALMKVPRQSRHLVRLHVMRLRKNGVVTMAKPCPLCQVFLCGAGVTKVWYTNWQGQWERLSLS